MECELCHQEIDVQYAPTGEVAWAEGHNAAPLAEGQCCTNCNETRVFPARLTAKGYGPEFVAKFLEGWKEMQMNTK